MNSADINLWYAVGAKFLSEDSDGYIGIALDKYLGMDEYDRYISRPACEDYPMRIELRRLLEGFNGPHGAALIKAYRIQRGLE